MTDYAELNIYSDNYSLVDRILYGGICSGAIVIPTNFIKIIFTLIFPPIGTILEIIGKDLIEKFPYISWQTLKTLLSFNNINKIIYTFILTSMFYVPGLIYALAQITTSKSPKGVLQCDPNTGVCTQLKPNTTPSPT